MIDTLKQQINFPEEDLENDNADFLLRFMQKPWLSHAIAFENRLTHPENAYARLSLMPETPITDISHAEHSIAKQALIGSAMAPMPGEQASFSYGYTLFESITALVSPAPEKATIPAHVTTAFIEDTILKQQSLAQRYEIARESLVSTQPVSTELIKHSTHLLDSSFSQDHALTGAAVRREIELIIRSYRRHFDQ